MQATVRASPNIALIKYWGKRDEKYNLPDFRPIAIGTGDTKGQQDSIIDYTTVYYCTLHHAVFVR